MTKRELFEKYQDASLQAALDRIESGDAESMLAQLRSAGSADAKLRIAKRWLKKHWTDGWMAADGPSGMPEEFQAPAKARRAGR